jgi:hypothetical protein
MPYEGKKNRLSKKQQGAGYPKIAMSRHGSHRRHRFVVDIQQCTGVVMVMMRRSLMIF